VPSETDKLALQIIAACADDILRAYQGRLAASERIRNARIVAGDNESNALLDWQAECDGAAREYRRALSAIGC
jgi:hypothetical protein